MDEYLFLTMAKLKADRLKLEREQRELAQSQEPQSRPSTERTKQAPRPHIPLFNWR
jgi:hypothetical protein